MQGLQALAPEKDSGAIRRSMARLRLHIDDAKGARADHGKTSVISLPQSRKTVLAPPPRFAPGGQSTQMIVGADATSDSVILQSTATLYSAYQLRRVYYSAFSPIPDASSRLPLRQPHRRRAGQILVVGNAG